MKKLSFLAAFLALNTLVADYSFDAFRDGLRDYLGACKNEMREQADKAAAFRESAQKINKYITAEGKKLSCEEIAHLKSDYVAFIQQVKKTEIPCFLKQRLDEIIALKAQYEDEELKEKAQEKITDLSSTELQQAYTNLVSRVVLPGVCNIFDFYSAQLQTELPFEQVVGYIFGIEGSLAECLNDEERAESIALMVKQNHIDKITDNVSAAVYEAIKASSKPVIVDCYGDYCPPCKMMKPIFEKVSQEYKDTYNFMAVDIAQAPEFADVFEIQAVPTFLFIKDGELIGRFSGALPEAAFKNKIVEILQ